MFLTFVGFLLFLSTLSLSSSKSFTVDYANHQFLKDGQPFRYISGSIHYFRVHPDQWSDRLQRIRALGLNAIQVYVPWNLHEETEGNFDFSGPLNLTHFLTLAQQNDLYVLLRPGPYICAEWENGGLPWWLLKDPFMSLRTSDPIYLSIVQKYFAKLFEVINPYTYKNGGPILMVQVENEYGAILECDHNYTTYLRDLIWGSLGDDVQLYTTDNSNDRALSCGAVPGVLATCDFGPSLLSDIDQHFELQYNHSNGGPTVCSEFWVDWFLTWGQSSQTELTPDFVIDNMMHMFYNWQASFNIYMIFGGTNFGFMNGAEVYAPITTSYDYGAAIAENGAITPLYHAIHSFISNLTFWDQKPLSIPPNNPTSNYGPITMKRLGSSLVSILSKIQEPCQKNVIPLSFEDINHGFGFVLYTTTLKTSGTDLMAPGILDYGYVFLNNVYQGMLQRDLPNTIKIKGNQGDTLAILVENRGRVNFTPIPLLDRKGLHSVTLDKNSITDWYACGINLTKSSVDSLTSSHPDNEIFELVKDSTYGPGIYVGQFTTNQPEDTFFDSTGWGKGQFFVNGYNIGRYWPSEGPQVTLYVPKPYLQKTNTVVLMELIGSQQNTANFIDHAVFKFGN